MNAGVSRFLVLLIAGVASIGATPAQTPTPVPALLVPPLGWQSASPDTTLSQKDWVVLSDYAGASASGSDSEFIEVSRGPNKAALSIADYVYLDVELLKRNFPDLQIQTDREAALCNGVTGWLLEYERSVDGHPRMLTEAIAVTPSHAYRAIYVHDPGRSANPQALSAVGTLCPPAELPQVSKRS